MLVSGDLLVDPVTFALDCYPTEWLHTLEKIDALDCDDAGAGPRAAAARSSTLLHATMAAFKRVIEEGRAAKARGLDPDQARRTSGPACTT